MSEWPAVQLYKVNKRSGVFHRPECIWLRDVPDGALRSVYYSDDDWPPPNRLCPTCFPPAPPPPRWPRRAHLDAPLPREP